MTCFGFVFFFLCEPAVAAPPPAVPYCEVALPIRWSEGDARTTKEAVDTENRKWVRFCRAKGG